MTDVARGRQFHEQCERLGFEHHDGPEPEGHLEAVGAALRTALDEGDPVTACTLYNAWAEAHGYVPISAWSATLRGFDVSFGPDVAIHIGSDGTVTEGVCR